jgi:hypothetical protein
MFDTMDFMKKQNKPQSDDELARYRAIGIPWGMLCGILVGIVFLHNIGSGIAMGMPLGVAFGLVFGMSKNK